MSSEKFCLRWNDFESNISSAFRELRDDKDFFDVTLACDDEQIQAHKVILSACSPFFRNVLRRNPHQHPLLYLKNVKYTDLQSVLNFMYHGEVNVAQEELNSFLSVAEDLKIKGLTQNNAGSATPKETSSYKARKEAPAARTFQRPPDREPPPSRHPQPAPPVHHPQDDEITEVVPIKSEPRDIIDQSRPTTTKPHHVGAGQAYSHPQPVALPEVQEDSLTPYQEEEEGYEEYGQYDDQYGQQEVDMALGQQGVQAAHGPQTPSDLSKYIISDQHVKQYHCSLCDSFKAKLPSKVKNHVEAIHFPGLFVYTCDLCQKTCKGKNALNVHKSLLHNNKAKHI